MREKERYISPEIWSARFGLSGLSLTNSSWSDVSGGGSYGNGDIHNNGEYEIINY